MWIAWAFLRSWKWAFLWSNFFSVKKRTSFSFRPMSRCVINSMNMPLCQFEQSSSFSGNRHSSNLLPVWKVFGVYSPNYFRWINISRNKPRTKNGSFCCYTRSIRNGKDREPLDAKRWWIFPGSVPFRPVSVPVLFTVNKKPSNADVYCGLTMDGVW